MTSHSHTARKEAAEKPAAPLTEANVKRCIMRAKNFLPQSNKARGQLRLARASFDLLPGQQRTRELEEMIHAAELSHG